MDDADVIIDRARYDAANSGGEGDRDLRSVVPVLDALNRGGLSYAIDWFPVDRLERAADAGRRLGADRIADMLAEAVGIAKSRDGQELDAAIAAFDTDYPARTFESEMRAAVDTRRRQAPNAFAAVRTDDGSRD